MAVYKCKMCGDDLPVVEGKTVVECESCGTVQTIPTAKEEGIQKTFNRANTLRMKSEFDKAEQLYEKIIQADETQSEAYWGLLLCKYGIEYVEDPKTLERKPTCHRASYDSIVADDDYKSALQYADAVQREIYEKQAAEIDRIQKEILELSRKEEPYDVFICYKETDEEGKRTEDSVIANDIYYELTNAGFKVFYAAITLEDKLGSAYEPCIFAALHSAKVMLSIGTKPEYFNAVWVKNEWSRYLALMKKDRSKLLIPCYRDMDAYDLPDEFAHLQAQDMSKIGFINDIVRGIKKVIAKEEKPKAEKETATESTPISSNAKALLKRGQLALDDGEWQAATEFFDEVLNQNAECAEAYLGQKLAQEHMRSLDAFVEKRKSVLQNLQYEKIEAVAENTDLIADSIAKFNKYNIIYKSDIQQAYEFDRQYDSCVSSCQKILDDENTYWQEDKYLSKVLRFANGAFAEKISTKRKEIMDAIVSRMENEKKNDAVNIKDITDGYRTQCDKATATLQEKFDKRLEEKYQDYCLQEKKANTASAFQKVSDLFGGINGYRDTEEHMKQCQTASKECKIKEEKIKKAKRRKKKIIISVVCVFLVCAIGTGILIQNLFIPLFHYQKAESLLAENRFDEAAAEFEQAGKYSNAQERISEIHEVLIPDFYYQKAESLLAEGKFEESIVEFEKLGYYSDAEGRILEAHYKFAEYWVSQGNREKAIEEFKQARYYSDAPDRVSTLINDKHYYAGEQFLSNGEYDSAISEFVKAGNYSNAKERILEVYYTEGKFLIENDRYEDALLAFDSAGDYKDSQEYVLKIKNKIYDDGQTYLKKQDYENAIDSFTIIEGYKDVEENIIKAYYLYGKELMQMENWIEAVMMFDQVGNYRDSKELIKRCYKNQIEQYVQKGQYQKVFDFTLSKKLDNLFVAIPYSQQQRYYEEISDIACKRIKSSQNIRNIKDILQAEVIAMSYLPAGYKDSNKIKDFYRLISEFNGSSIKQFYNSNKNKINLYFSLDEVQTIFLSNIEIEEFMLGKWKDNSQKYYLEFYKENSNTTTISLRYNLPYPYVNHKYYDITRYYDDINFSNNITYKLIFTNDNNVKVADVYKFNFIDANTVSVYCYKDGSTHILKRLAN